MPYASILITGDGFVANAIRSQLIATSPDTRVSSFSLHCGQDLRDVTAIERAAADSECIIHTAALTDVASGMNGSLSDKIELVGVNLVGTLNVLDVCRRFKLKLVYISTCFVYGGSPVPGCTLSEEHALLPEMGTYAVTKAAADHECRLASKLRQQDVVILRPFILYGQGQSSRKLIPTLLRQAISRQPLTILGKGLQKRDYLHVADFAQAAQLACDLPSGTIANCGTGNCHTVLEVAEIISELTREHLGYLPSIEFYAGHSDGAEYRGDHKVLKQHLGWQPRYGLRLGLETLLKECCERPIGGSHGVFTDFDASRRRSG